MPPMPRTFAYVRVSTTGQTTENQIQEIEAAGFKVAPTDWFRVANARAPAIARSGSAGPDLASTHARPWLKHRDHTTDEDLSSDNLRRSHHPVR